jgi:sulfur carrier protein
MTTTPIRVVVNGLSESYPADTTLGAVVSRVRPSRTGIAVAIGDDVVPRAEWDTRRLCEGDEIEILTAVQGG